MNTLYKMNGLTIYTITLSSLNSIQKVNVELAFGVQGEMQTAAGQIA
jgi:hypothetical protein